MTCQSERRSVEADPTLKITHSRKAIHLEICLPEDFSHFLRPLQTPKASTTISTMFTVVFERDAFRKGLTRKLLEGRIRMGKVNGWMESDMCIGAPLCN